MAASIAALSMTLALAPSSQASPSSAPPDQEGAPGVRTSPADPPLTARFDDAEPPRHSSDRVRGPLATPRVPGRLVSGERSRRKAYRVVPGLRFSQWDQTDARGTFRASLLRGDLSRPRLRLEYASLRHVPSRGRLRHMVVQDGAIAGINGDFFDIGDTGAPLGIGVDQGAVRNGPRAGWITSFVVRGRSGTAIERSPVHATVVGAPEVTVTNVNSPWVAAHGIGVYTPRWGRVPGYAVTDGAKRTRVREVVVRRGRVVSNRQRLSTQGSVRGRILVGRGAGARALQEQLAVGQRVRVSLGATDQPRVGISGNQVLVEGGAVVVDDDRQLHPRTAVGVDTDTDTLMMLVVDGRQSFSRGLTLRELAVLMKDLGAEEALNLDGGGSSTMVARRPSGRVGVVNSPSDGSQRPVPNGLQLRWLPKG